MEQPTSGSDLTPRLVEQLYAEALLLADEARGYFDGDGRDDRDELGAGGGVTFACESLKATSRLMHVLAWLLARRADGGDADAATAREPARRLGEEAGSGAEDVAGLPLRARLLIARSQELYARVARLDGEGARQGEVASPARSLQGRLEQSF